MQCLTASQMIDGEQFMILVPKYRLGCPNSKHKTMQVISTETEIKNGENQSSIENADVYWFDFLLFISAL